MKTQMIAASAKPRNAGRKPFLVAVKEVCSLCMHRRLLWSLPPRRPLLMVASGDAVGGGLQLSGGSKRGGLGVAEWTALTSRTNPPR